MNLSSCVVTEDGIIFVKKERSDDGSNSEWTQLQRPLPPPAENISESSLPTTKFKIIKEKLEQRAIEAENKGTARKQVQSESTENNATSVSNNNDGTAISNSPSGIMSTFNSFRCELCGKHFMLEKHLKSHHRQHHAKFPAVSLPDVVTQGDSSSNGQQEPPAVSHHTHQEQDIWPPNDGVLHSYETATSSEEDSLDMQDNGILQSSSQSLVTISNSTSAAVMSTATAGSIPPSSAYDSASGYSVTSEKGVYGFQVNFGKTAEFASKNASATYSGPLQKLFANLNKKVPIGFRCGSAPPPGTLVRVSVSYKQVQHASDIIKLCPVHLEKAGPGSPLHFVEVMAPAHVNCLMMYDVDAQTKRESVCIEYLHQTTQQQPPPSGDDAPYFWVVYRFMCLSSCSVIRRRDICLTMTLESIDGHEYGRHSVDFIVSTCPGRDRAKAEFARYPDKIPRGPTKRKRHHPVTALPGSENAIPTDKNGKFLLPVETMEDYHALKEFRDFLAFKRHQGLNSSS